MIYLYALDPALPAHWHSRPSFGYWKDQFGVGRPRLISAHPTAKRWRKEVRDAATRDGKGLHGMDLKRFEALIKLLLEEEVLVDRGDTYDGEVSWLDNALAAHRARPFRGILSPDADRRDRGVIHATEHPPDSDLWEVPELGPIPRDSDSLAARVQPLLENACEITLVDPYFDFRKQRFTAPILSMLARIGTARTRPPAVTLLIGEIWRKGDRPATLAVSAADHERYSKSSDAWAPSFANRLPANMAFSVQVLKERTGGEELHDRFVLTEIGGVQMTVGLDSGREGTFDGAQELNTTRLKHAWKAYVNPCGFDVIRKWTLSGEPGAAFR